MPLTAPTAPLGGPMRVDVHVRRRHDGPHALRRDQGIDECGIGLVVRVGGRPCRAIPSTAASAILGDSGDALARHLRWSEQALPDVTLLQSAYDVLLVKRDLESAPGFRLHLCHPSSTGTGVLVQRELDNPPIVLSNSPPRPGRGPWYSSLPPAGVLGLGSGTAGGRPFRPVTLTSPGTG